MSRLAAEAAGQVVEKVGVFAEAVRAAAKLPGELVTESDEIATAIDEQLSKIGELMRRWF